MKGPYPDVNIMRIDCVCYVQSREHGHGSKQTIDIAVSLFQILHPIRAWGIGTTTVWWIRAFHQDRKILNRLLPSLWPRKQLQKTTTKKQSTGMTGTGHLGVPLELDNNKYWFSQVSRPWLPQTRLVRLPSTTYLGLQLLTLFDSLFPWFVGLRTCKRPRTSKTSRN